METQSKVAEQVARECTYEVTCEEEHSRIEGNCLASGDAEEDAKCAAWIRAELDSGNEWAWCTVRVRATWRGLRGDAYLGQCSYESREAFSAEDGYLPQMREEALADLVEQVERVQLDNA